MKQTVENWWRIVRGLPLLVEVLFVLICVRLGLRLLPFPVLTGLMSTVAFTLGRVSSCPSNPDAVRDAIVTAVRRVRSRFCTGLTCLEEALVIRWYLRRRGVESEICFGVARVNQGQLVAHAWVESSGRVISVEPAQPMNFVRLGISISKTLDR